MSEELQLLIQKAMSERRLPEGFGHQLRAWAQNHAPWVLIPPFPAPPQLGRAVRLGIFKKGLRRRRSGLDRSGDH